MFTFVVRAQRKERPARVVSINPAAAGNTKGCLRCLPKKNSGLETNPEFVSSSEFRVSSSKSREFNSECGSYAQQVRNAKPETRNPKRETRVG